MSESRCSSLRLLAPCVPPPPGAPSAGVCGGVMPAWCPRSPRFPPSPRSPPPPGRAWQRVWQSRKCVLTTWTPPRRLLALAFLPISLSSPERIFLLGHAEPIIARPPEIPAVWTSRRGAAPGGGFQTGIGTGSSRWRPPAPPPAPPGDRGSTRVAVQNETTLSHQAFDTRTLPHRRGRPGTTCQVRPHLDARK